MKLDLHIRFNPLNGRHRQAAAYMEPVRAKYRTTLFVAAIEEYRQNHPYGVDYRQLEEIRKGSHRSFQPKVPIQENLRRQSASSQPPASGFPELSGGPDGAADTLDQVIDLYDLDDEE